MVRLHQGEFVNRVNIAEWLNHRNMHGIAVEIGTHRGDFAYAFLSKWKGKRLYCIDPWTNPPGYEGQAKLLPGGGVNRQEDYRIAYERFAGKLAERVCFVRNTSQNAAKTFENKTPLLDMIYIDGDHRYEMVMKDMELWYPMIAPGGLLAGHDFMSRMPYTAYENVQRAVMDFAVKHNLDIYVVPELEDEPEFQPWSFYMVKPTA